MSINLNVALPTCFFKALNLRQSKALQSYALLILILMLGLFIFVSRSGAAGQVLFQVEPPTQTVGVGEVFNSTIQIDIPSPGGVGFQIELGWDPSVINCTGVQDIMFHNVTPSADWSNIWQLPTQINNTAGTAGYAYTWMDLPTAEADGYAPISGNYTLATITFQGINNGYSSLKLLQVKASDVSGNPMPCASVDGSVVVGNPPPAITVISPQNTTYNEASVNLTIELSKPASWVGYSLDGQANVTVTSNVLSVPDGHHSLIVYANNTAGNMGSSETVYFTVDTALPTALFTYLPQTPEAQFAFGTFRWEFNFSGSASYDNVSGIASYFWDFGDGTNATGIMVTHIYRESGDYNVTLTVTNNAGSSATQVEKISIAPASQPLNIPLGLVAATVIPVVWIPGLCLYVIRMRRKRKRV
jgi:PKD repeat protein